MGYQGIDWLERPERETEEHLTQLVDVLKLVSRHDGDHLPGRDNGGDPCGILDLGKQQRPLYP